MPRRMLTVTIRKIFHFVLDFSSVLVYTSSVICKEGVSGRKVRSTSLQGDA